MKPAGSISTGATGKPLKKDAVPPLNLQFAKSTSNANNGNKGLFYAEVNKSKLSKVQSPINNYKRFLTQNSESKGHGNSQANSQSHSLLKPQIIQRPKI